MKVAIAVLEQTGLCSTCAHKATCTTRMSFNGQIFHCEEFDNLTDHLPKPSANGVGEQRVSFEYAPLKGLCMNCDKARTCSLPKSPEGVWYCNEYK
jgi:hypothetical protein